MCYRRKDSKVAVERLDVDIKGDSIMLEVYGWNVFLG